MVHRGSDNSGSTALQLTRNMQMNQETWLLEVVLASVAGDTGVSLESLPLLCGGVTIPGYSTDTSGLARADSMI